ncbi:MAG: alpha/beta hydrolase [Sedimentisphaeraceae bacterium JB056]
MILDNEILLRPELPDRRDEEIIREIDEEHNFNKYIENVQNPSIVPFLVDSQDNTPAVIICPGGGYEILSWIKEGSDVAKWFNSIGVSAFVLKYRLKAYGHPHTLSDALLAIEYVRSNSSEFNIDPKRIGIAGFSAGGHLAASASVHFKPASRPDFSVLIYPVISMDESFGHTGSKENLVSGSTEKNLADYYSLERHVKDDTPPAFLVHTAEDQVVDVRNSIVYYTALRSKNINVEMHLYHHGPHGFGMVDSICNAAGDWPGRCKKWMIAEGFLKAK